MKIQNALNRFSTPFILKSWANNKQQKTVAIKGEELFPGKKARDEFPCLPWLLPNLSKLEWTKLNDAYRTGTNPKRVCSDKERAMLKLVGDALSYSKSIELLMVSFRKG